LTPHEHDHTPLLGLMNGRIELQEENVLAAVKKNICTKIAPQIPSKNFNQWHQPTQVGINQTSKIRKHMLPQ
jgi:hypothetical protein